jgi:sugar phosphate isomerase/epimerase
MRLAIQTISWGQHPDVEQMLRDIASLGYEGVELAQHPDALGTPDELFRRLSEHGLTLVGMAGGSLNEKIEYTTRYVTVVSQAALQAQPRDPESPRPARLSPYLCVDEWEVERSAAALSGNRLAVHPHMFKPVQTAREAEALLERYPSLWFLPDTGHLAVAGENVLDVLKQNYDRVIAVHLKDWIADYGRAYQFYSRGFVELGQGDVELSQIIEFLKSKRFGGWLVVEQDTTRDPCASARASRTWLRNNCGL